MKIFKLICNNCGGPLEVPQKSRFVTCTFCNTPLRIERSGGAAYTEVLEQIDERTEKMAGDLETIKLQNEVERLDREWDLERSSFIRQDKNGRHHLPSKAGTVIGAVLAIGGGILFLSLFSQAPGAPAPFRLFPVIFIVFGVLSLVFGMSRAQKYESARSAYEARRRQAMRRLEQRV